MTEAYTALMSYTRDTLALRHAASLIEWDQETMMPCGAATQRAACLGTLTGIIQERDKNPQVREWLEKIDEATLRADEQAQIREIRRSVSRAERVPVDLARALTETTSRGQQVWNEARAKNDPAAFLPLLDEIVGLSRQIGQALNSGIEPYDSLLDDYEPGMTGQDLDVLFGCLQPGLVALRDRLLGAPEPPSLHPGTYASHIQLHLARELAGRFGYDFHHGRLDLVTHPFCCGVVDDVRITTRVDEADPFNCLYSTIHETGHATYEANVDKVYAFTPIGGGASMGVHESQSRLYENQLGRSRPFAHWLHGRMQELFGDAGTRDPSVFYAGINRLRKNPIRADADEVQYNLHIILRFQIERQLINGVMTAGDVPEVWNEKFLEMFGFPVDRPSNGFLQDVHWSAGYFGYFPTYTLGNLYAACLHQTLQARVPSLESSLARGDPSPATQWLRESLQQYGGLRLPRETIETACGFRVSETPLLTSLAAKFEEIYGL